MPSRLSIEKIEDCLTENGVTVCKEEEPCDVSIAVFGAYTNPLALKGEKVLIYWVQNDMTVWSLAFYSLYLPILHEYYDRLIDLTNCNTLTEIGENIVKYVEQYRYATD